MRSSVRTERVEAVTLRCGCVYVGRFVVRASVEKVHFRSLARRTRAVRCYRAIHCWRAVVVGEVEAQGDTSCRRKRSYIAGPLSTRGRPSMTATIANGNGRKWQWDGWYIRNRRGGNRVGGCKEWRYRHRGNSHRRNPSSLLKGLWTLK